MSGPPLQVPAIEAVGLTKRYYPARGWRALLSRRRQEKVALEDVSLSIAPGEVFGLLGPNGAGKTTLVKILSTLVLPSAGRATIGGLDVVAQGPAVRRRIGVIYGDERTFFLRLSALENLRFYAALQGLPTREAERRIGEVLKIVGLDHAVHLRMQHFSTGMKQRAAIARGLLADPDVLFMDEPTHNLDPIAAREVRRLVHERVADGRRTVLLATNIMAEAEDLCHRLAILSHGRVQLTGSIVQLRRRLQVEEAHELVVSQADEATLDGVWRVPGVHNLSVSRLDEATCRLDLTVERHSATLPQVIRYLVEHGANVWSSTPRELSLEEMFAIALDGQPVRPAGGGGDGPMAYRSPERELQGAGRAT